MDKWDQCHAFLDCPKIQGFWKENHQELKNILGIRSDFGIKIMLFGLIPQEWTRKDKYFTNILLVAAKKALIRKWRTSDVPDVGSWISIVEDIHKMEEMTAHVNLRKDPLILHWEK